MVLLGAWLAIGGYLVLFTGFQKLGGDVNCTVGKALRGQCGQAPAVGGGAGLTSRARAAQLHAQQHSLFGYEPLLEAVA